MHGRLVIPTCSGAGLQPGNEDVAAETLIEPELLITTGQVRQVLPRPPGHSESVEWEQQSAVELYEPQEKQRTMRA